MHKYDRIKNLADNEFRRLTFESMVLILKEAELKKNKSGGETHRLSIEARLLMALEYL